MNIVYNDIIVLFRFVSFICNFIVVIKNICIKIVYKR